MSHHPISVNSGKFNLDISGVAAFFGGDAAIQAIKTVHLYKSRRWTGWYNAPGGLAVAKYIGPVANSRFWNTLFLVEHSEDPETVFGLNNELGPRFIGFHTGMIISMTTHVAHLIIQKSKQENLPVTNIGGRITVPVTLMIINVTDTSRVQSSALVEASDAARIIMRRMDHDTWLVSIPISASLTACALCAYNRDWYCLAVIFLGIISNGLTCLVVGSLSLVIKGVHRVEPPSPGDGILMDDDLNHISILKGAEKDVNWITTGRFYLEYLPGTWMKRRQETWSSGPEEYRGIGLCGLLLSIQSLLQLLLIPQGTSFGQIMFLFSLVISWGYNLYLSPFFKKKTQQDLLFRTLDVKHSSRFELGTRTMAAVFAALVLQPPSPIKPTQQPRSIKLLKVLMPNKTMVWEKWREHVGEHIGTAVNWTQDTRREEVEEHLESLKNCNFAGMREMEKVILQSLLHDAVDAFEGYYNFLMSGPGGASK